MSYVVESGSSQRARKRRRTAVTLLVVVALLAAAFLYASTYWKTQLGKSNAAGCPTSTTKTAAAVKGAAPTPGQITVNVYNATARDGLAGATAKLVKTRGFVVGTIGNDPLNKSIAAPAEIRFGKNGQPASKVVLGLVAGAVPVTDARADASVDLVLGEGFQALKPPTPVKGGTASAQPADC